MERSSRDEYFHIAPLLSHAQQSLFGAHLSGGIIVILGITNRPE